MKCKHIIISCIQVEYFILQSKGQANLQRKNPGLLKKREREREIKHEA